MCLLVVMLISAVAEVVSLGAVLPFLGILTAPQVVLKHPMASGLMQYFGWQRADQLVLPLTIAFAVAALAAGVIRMVLLWASTRVAFDAGADLSIDVYRRTLYQPYQVHVARNSSEIISGITTKVGGAVNVLYNALTLLSSILFLVTITAAIMYIDPVVALVASAGFGACYGLVAVMMRGQLRRNSQRITEEQTQVIKALQEGLGGIRDVLLDGSQPVYCDIYRRADIALRRAQGDNLFVGGSPRYAMEAAGMVLIAALAYGLSLRPGGMTAALPILGALALGAQRLIPALQQGYGAWVSIAGNHASLHDVIVLLDQRLPEHVGEAGTEALPWCQSLEFESVSFRYGDSGPWVLNGLNLRIPKGSRVGFVGTTGSGKSTTLDILMGLLQPSSGRFLVDGRVVDDACVRSWQRCVAHVPQAIYLADATIEANIAFGVPASEIDSGRVRRAADQAQLTAFIESQPQGFQTVVGERGVRLSGGQRQRIGIARALYKNAHVLVFDEATSALDNATEQSVMESIRGLDRELTILIIAHRLSTLKHCDMVVRLAEGKIVDQGSYQYFCETNADFSALSGAGV